MGLASAIASAHAESTLDPEQHGDKRKEKKGAERFDLSEVGVQHFANQRRSDDVPKWQFSRIHTLYGDA